jgi:hypothetical protein
MPRSPTPPAEVPAHHVISTEPMPAGPPLADAIGEHGPDDLPARRSQKSRAAWQRWSRVVHAYTSMAALLVVLFFGITGITLNHPDWTLGFETATSKVSGTLPAGSVSASGEPQLLVISEHIRNEQNVRGTVAEFGTTPSGGFISYRGPGYSADATFDTAAHTYAASVEQQGLIGVANDLHKGRNTTGSWGWLIDVSGLLLVAIALSGLTLQLVLRRRRRSTLVAAGVLAVIVSVWAVVAIH